MTVGIVALQGDVREHAAALGSLGTATRAVRTPAELEGLAGVVLPGGESTTLSLLLESSGLREALGEALAGGMPVLGTCAGMILLASGVVDGRPDQRGFGILDVAVRRNGFGRQRASFETTLVDHALGGGPLPAVFIRAPRVESVGAGVEVLARLDSGGGSVPVLCRQGRVLACAYHPELTSDDRVHRLFVAMTKESRS